MIIDGHSACRFGVGQSASALPLTLTRMSNAAWKHLVTRDTSRTDAAQSRKWIDSLESVEVTRHRWKLPTVHRDQPGLDRDALRSREGRGAAGSAGCATSTSRDRCGHRHPRSRMARGPRRDLGGTSAGPRRDLGGTSAGPRRDLWGRSHGLTGTPRPTARQSAAPRTNVPVVQPRLVEDVDSVNVRRVRY